MRRIAEKHMAEIRIEHIAIYVNDLEGAKEFFEKYFGAKSNEKYHNIKRDSGRIFFLLTEVQDLKLCQNLMFLMMISL